MQNEKLLAVNFPVDLTGFKNLSGLRGFCEIIYSLCP